MITPYIVIGRQIIIPDITPGITWFFGVHKLTLMSHYPILENDIYIPNHIDGTKLNN